MGHYASSQRLLLELIGIASESVTTRSAVEIDVMRTKIAIEIDETDPHNATKTKRNVLVIEGIGPTIVTELARRRRKRKEKKKKNDNGRRKSKPNAREKRKKGQKRRI